jgi:hypothetical protein
MTTEIFRSWFDAFLLQVKNRPLFLIFDGHKTHVSLSIIKKAKDNNVSLLKLPSHLTHRLQPLDKSCFKPLKSLWNQKLVSYQREHNFRIITKSECVDLLCEVWKNGLSSANIQSGFRETGIFPVDRSKYPTDMFKKVDLIRHESSSQLQQEPSPLILPRPTPYIFSASTPLQSPRTLSCVQQPQAAEELSSTVPSTDNAGPSSTSESLHEVSSSFSKVHFNLFFIALLFTQFFRSKFCRKGDNVVAAKRRKYKKALQ